MRADEMHPQARAAAERTAWLEPLHERNRHLLRALERGGSWYRNRNPLPVGAAVDREIPGPDGDLPIRVYQPDASGPFSTVVFFHGGGFVLGSIASHDHLCRMLTRETGCVVVSVGYRLAPEHPFPAAVEDAYAATEWAADHPEEFASDGRLAVAGDSAGGTLAAVVALMAAERGGPDIGYQGLVYPAVGVEEDQASVVENDGIVLSKGDLEWFRDCYYGSDVHLRNPYADPSNPCDRSGLPPATVVTAGFDPLRDGGVRYAEQLASAGVDVTHRHHDDMVHGFATSPDVDRATTLVDDMAADLKRAL